MEAVANVLQKPNLPSISGVDKETADFAVNRFPQISPDLIQRNYSELASVMGSEKCCRVCMSLDMCEELLNTNGFHPVLNLQSDGWMKVEYKPCRYSTFRVKGRAKVLAFTEKEESQNGQSSIDFGKFGSEV
jgi:hypothetical protein